jgi:HSP20 family molecular chaperone IbpA
MKRLILNRLFIMFSVAFSLAFLTPAFAQENTEQMIQDMKYQIKTLQEKLAELKGSCEPNTTSNTTDALNTTTTTTVVNDPAEIEKMKERMNRLFAEKLKASGIAVDSQTPDADLFFEPKVDMTDLKDHYLIKADLPGMDKNKINVEVGENFVQISGERTFESSEQKDSDGSYQTDRSFGSFSRQFSIPENVVVDKVDARYENGVLTVRVDKKPAVNNEKSAARKVEIL